MDEWIVHTNHGRNLEHTTASAYLWQTWDRIKARDWDAAQKALGDAIRVDAADSRISAYLGIVAKGRGKTPEAIACYRAALAQTAARAWYRGVPDKGPVSIATVARTIAIRLRLGALYARSDPARAATTYLQNVVLEPRVGDYAFSTPAPAALLPDARPGSVEIPTVPVAGALFRECRARVAIALSDAGLHREAIAHFRKLKDYRARTTSVQAHLDGGDLVSISPPTWLAAIRSLEAVGNKAHAWAWLMQARRYFEGSAAGQGDVLRPRYEEFKRRIQKPGGVRDQTLSQMGSDVFRAANVSQPSKSVDGRQQQAASFRRLVEMKSQKIARLPAAQRAASQAELDKYIATHAPASIPTPARRTGGGGGKR